MAKKNHWLQLISMVTGFFFSSLLVGNVSNFYWTRTSTEGEMISVYRPLTAKEDWCIVSDMSVQEFSQVNSSRWEFDPAKGGYLFTPQTTNDQGFLFVNYPHEEYSIRVRATLGQSTRSSSPMVGGYAVFFETELSDSTRWNLGPTGYSVQFDRGLNQKIVIRRWVNGSEQRPSLEISVNKSNDWWFESHDMIVQVTKIPEQEIVSGRNKELNVWIDDELIVGKWPFESTVQKNANHTGFRIWFASGILACMRHTTLTKMVPTPIAWTIYTREGLKIWSTAAYVSGSVLTNRNDIMLHPLQTITGTLFANGFSPGSSIVSKFTDGVKTDPFVPPVCIIPENAHTDLSPKISLSSGFFPDGIHAPNATHIKLSGTVRISTIICAPKAHLEISGEVVITGKISVAYLDVIGDATITP